MAERPPVHLVLLRHGIALDREDPDCPDDPERPLTSRGKDRVARTARRLAAAGVAPKAILCSPYLRARQTAEIAAKAFGIKAKSIETDEALVPLAEPAAILRRIAEREREPILLVGHAPHLDRLIAFCLDEDVTPLTALKKGGAACLRLEALDPPEARLEWLVTPKLLGTARG